MRARVTQDQLRFYGVGMSLPQWVSLFDDYRGLYLVIKMMQWNSPPSLLTVATIHVLQVYCGGYSQVALDAAEPISVTSHCCHDTRSLLRRLLAISVRSPEGFSDIALSKVGFEDLSFSAKATNCDSHLKALAMVTTVR